MDECRRARPAPAWRRVLRVSELVLLFVVFPVGLTAAGVRVPIIPALWVLTGVSLVVLLASRTYDGGDFFRLEGFRGHFARILTRFLPLAALLTVIVALAMPDRLFVFAKSRPWIYAVVMVLYPLLSAYPQGIVYRGFFFHRYSSLFGHGYGLIAAAAVAFALAHVVLGNWVAVVLTVPAGFMFADTYRRSRSLLIASMEHAMYGDLVFTLGLGWYFYGGARG